jgi:nucleoside-diphosphate-sugar epimerase
MKILVTGATGFIGSALIRHLISIDGHEVVGMVRSKENMFNDQEKVEFREGEIGSLSEFNMDLHDIDLIIHTAGRAHIMRDHSANSIEEFRSVNTLGTLKLARLAAKAGVKRFIFLSSIKVNGNSTEQGIPFTIDSIENPEDAYGISKHEAEMGLRKLSCDTDLETTIIRLPLVYGPEVKGNFNSLVKLLSSSIPLPLASLKNNRRSMVGLDNLLSLISLCLIHPNAVNKTFLVSDNNDLSTSELLEVLGNAIGKPANLFEFPEPILVALAKLFLMNSKIQRITGTLQVDISFTCSQLDWHPPFSVKYCLRNLRKTLK